MKGTGWIRAAKSGYIATSMLWCAAGLLLIFLPGTSVKLLCMAAGGLLTVCGIIKIIGYFSKDLYRLAFQFDLALGLLCLLLGLILLCNPVGFTTFVHFLIGIVVLTDSMFKLQTAFDAKRFGISNWWVIGLTSLLTGACGVLLVLNPFGGAKLIMRLIGITALLEGVLNLLVAVYAVKIQKQGKVDVIETHAEIKGEDDL